MSKAVIEELFWQWKFVLQVHVLTEQFNKAVLQSSSCHGQNHMNKSMFVQHLSDYAVVLSFAISVSPYYNKCLTSLIISGQNLAPQVHMFLVCFWISSEKGEEQKEGVWCGVTWCSALHGSLLLIKIWKQSLLEKKRNQDLTLLVSAVTIEYKNTLLFFA